jgi:hypothetical protein
MRRMLLIALLGTGVLVLPANAVAKKKPKPKPATFKTGTYKAKAGTTQFNITLKHGNCASAPGQSKSPLGLCVSLPVSPTVQCTVPIIDESQLGSFVAPIQLPSSGKLTQQTTVTQGPIVPGGGPATGQSTFSVAFKKNGTASGSLAQTLMLSVGTQTVPCTASESFTAKLG